MLMTETTAKATMESRSCFETDRVSTRPAGVIVSLALSAAIVISACGSAGVDGPAPAELSGAIQPSTVQEFAPVWQPNEALMQSILGSTGSQVGAPISEVGGTSAPGWQPNYALLEAHLPAANQARTGPR